MFIFVTCDVSPFAGFAWFLARAVLKMPTFVGNFTFMTRKNFTYSSAGHEKVL